MTSRDGELICPQCKTLLNTSDRLCWRCGGTNLQPGPKAKPALTEDLLIDLHKQVRDNPPPPVSLKWPVDANGTPLPADPSAACVCTPYYKCAYHAEKDALPARTYHVTQLPPFGVDPAWVESVRKGIKMASAPEIERTKAMLLKLYNALHDEMFNRAEPWDAV